MAQKYSNKLLRRFKLATALTLSAFSYSALTQVVAASEPAYTSPVFSQSYLWGSEEYPISFISYMSNGYVEEYTKFDRICNSWILLDGINLAPRWIPITIYLILFLWIVLGIMIAVDYFMQAITKITSATEKRRIIQQQEGKDKGLEIDVEVPVWNPTIASVSLLTLGGAAPEIFLCFFSTFIDIEAVPQVVGPMALIGSASFNVLVITGMSIMAVPVVKKIRSRTVFGVTVIFSLLAYAWLVMVLVVNTPGMIDLQEAFMTLAWYPIMLLFVWLADKCSPDGEGFESEKVKNIKLAQKTELRNLARDKGKTYVINVATGLQTQDQKEYQRIQTLFKDLLEVDDLNKKSVEDLLGVLEEDNPSPQLSFRDGAPRCGVVDSPLFVQMDAQYDFADKILTDDEKPSPYIGFEYQRYVVAEQADYVTIRIKKKIDRQISFWVVTQDDTAMSPMHFEPMRMMFHMSEKDKTRDIHIRINVDAEDWEAGLQFSVKLLDDIDTKPFIGCDTTAEVHIIDSNDAGFIGFKKSQMDASPLDNHIKVKLRRMHGATGAVSVHMHSRYLDGGSLIDMGDGTQEKRPPVVKGMRIKFDEFQDEKVVRIDVPKYNEDGSVLELFDENGLMKETKPIRFKLILTDPKSEDLDSLTAPELTRRTVCEVNFRFTNPYMVRRTRILKYIMYMWEPLWSNKFKNALEFGPTLNEYEEVTQPTCCKSFVQFIAIPWKVLGCFVPPVHQCGGKPAAFGSFLAIGGLTYLLIEISNVLACYTGISICLQAILGIATILALPDTFAAYKAAVDTDSIYADACIGTAAGANAVAIFVGLGLPWVNATIYHWAKYGQSFYIGRDSTIEITFALITFLACSATCYIILFFRRMCVGGELGGSRIVRFISGFIMFFLWVFFIVMNALHCMKVIKMDFGTDLPERDNQMQLTCAAQPDPPTLAEINQGSQINVFWTLPSDSLACQVVFQIPDPNEEGELVDQELAECPCDSDLTNGTCTLDAQVLHYEYNMGTCFPLIAKVRAENDDCPGDWSNESLDNVKVKGRIDKMDLQAPQEVQNRSQLILDWGSLNDQCMVTQSTLESKNTGTGWRKGEPTQAVNQDIVWLKRESDSEWDEEDLARRRLSSHDEGVHRCKEYQFRGRGQDGEWAGNYSQFLEIPEDFSCITPEGVAITMNYDAAVVEDVSTLCRVKLSWNPPSDDPEVREYTKYEISILARVSSASHYLDWNQLQADDIREQKVPGCPREDRPGEQTHCSVDMNTLKQEPFNLKVGDPINVKSKAKVDKWGPDEISEGQVSLATKPNINSATIIDEGAGKIVVRWDADNSGTYDDLELLQNGRKITDLVERREEITDQARNWLELAREAQGQPQEFEFESTDEFVLTDEFEIRASNVCGTYSHSFQLAHRCPGQVRSASVDRVGCSFSFTATAVTDSLVPVSWYKYEIKGQNGQWHETSCRSSHTSCEITAEDLQSAPFFIQDEDNVEFIVTPMDNSGECTSPASEIITYPNIRMPRPPNSQFLDFDVQVQNIDDGNDDTNLRSFFISWSYQAAFPPVDKIDLILTPLSGGRSYTTNPRLDQSSMTIPNIPEGAYKIEMGIQNNCGWSDYVSKTVENFPVPPTPRFVHVPEGVDPQVGTYPCGITVYWEQPGRNSNDPVILEYELQIEAKVLGVENTSWENYSDPVNCDMTQFECYIPIAVLRSAPYNHVNQNFVEIRMRARTVSGWGHWNPPGLGIELPDPQVKIPSKPVVFKDGTNARRVTVKWPQLNYFTYGPPVQSYELYQDDVLISNSLERSIQVENLQPGETYRFKTRAVTVCGESAFSEEESFTVLLTPASPQVNVQYEAGVDCKMSIQWTQPSSTAPEERIQQVYVLIKKSDGQYERQNSCSEIQRRCDISLPSLAEAPYFLQEGDPIEVEVILENIAGQSVPTVNSDTILRLPPTEVPTVQIENQQRDSYTLSWSSTEDHIVGYQLLYQKNQNPQSVLAETDQTTLTYDNVDPAGTYTVWVKAKSEFCGYSPASDASTRFPVSDSLQIKTSIGVEGNCAVIIEFSDPDTTGTDPILVYNFEIQAKNGANVNFPLSPSQNPGAQCINRPASIGGGKRCSVPMEQFRQDPYNLVDGDPILITGYAINRSGRSDPSAPEQNPVVVESKPSATVILSADSPIPGTVYLTWTDPDDQNPLATNTEGFEYEVYWDQGINAPWQLLGVTTDKEYLQPVESHSSQYQFAVKKANLCGRADAFSETLLVDIATEPEQVDSLVLSTSECSVRFSWIPQGDGGQPIIDYFVEAQDSNGIWKQLTQCGQSATSQSCVVEMDYFTNGNEFSLQIGQELVARVAARNAKGLSETSENSNSVILNGVPYTVLQTSMNVTPDFTQILWNQDPLHGDDLEYLVYIRETTTASNPFSTFEFSQRFDFTYSFDPNDCQITPYEFKVAARNSCGTGPESDVQTWTRTCRPTQGPSVEVVRKPFIEGVGFSWWIEVNSDGGSPITHYEVEIEVSDDVWEPLPEFCTRTLASGEINRQCDVKFTQFAFDPYNMVNGQLITVRARAVNVNGPGPWSETNYSQIPVVLSGITMDVTIEDNEDITITWYAQFAMLRSTFDPSKTFTIYYAPGQNRQDIENFDFLLQTDDLSESVTASYLEADKSQDEWFSFYVCECNEERQGRKSNTGSVQVLRELPPAQQQPLTTSLENCKVRINWNIPEERGSPHLGYMLQVRTSAGVWEPLTQNECSYLMTSTSCLVDLSVFDSDPFLINQGEKIYTRMAATSAIGMSTYSEMSTAQQVKAGKQPIDRPEFNHVEEDVKICWTDVLSQFDSSMNPVYSLYWQENPETDSDFTFKTLTTDTCYTIPVQDRTTSPAFQVKAMHDCGTSQNSQTCYHEHVSAPGKVPELTYQVNGCDVRFDWSAPTEEGTGGIDSYNLVVQNANGQFMQLNECGLDAQDLQCIVSLETLESDPFYLTINNNIVAKIAAQNDHGDGEFSDLQSSEIRMISTTVDAPILRSEEQTADFVKLCWTEVLDSHSSVRYEIYRNDETNHDDPVVFVGATTNTCYNVQLGQVSMLRGSQFDPSRPDLLYFIKATNGCAQVWSNSLRVQTAEAPGKPDLFISTKDCDFLLKWTEPVSSGHIIQYSLQVQSNYNQEWQTGSFACNRIELICRVSIRDLQEPPYNFEAGDQVSFRISAINEHGQGEYSDVIGQGFTLPDTIARMSAPIIQDRSTYTVTLEWNGVDMESYSSFNDQEITYEIWWSYGTGYNFELLSETVRTKFVVNIPSNSYEYQFRIRPYNHCGEGEFSTVLTVPSISEPGMPDPVIITYEDCFVSFIWRTPQNGGSPIIDFKLELGTYDESVQYFEFAHYQSGGRQPAINNWTWFQDCNTRFGSVSCVISMEELMEYPYNFENGHNIVARVTPRNMVGYGESSHTCPSDVRVLAQCNRLPSSISGFRIFTTRWVGVNNDLAGSSFWSYAQWPTRSFLERKSVEYILDIHRITGIHWLNEGQCIQAPAFEAASFHSDHYSPMGNVADSFATIQDSSGIKHINVYENNHCITGFVFYDADGNIVNIMRGSLNGNIHQIRVEDDEQLVGFEVRYDNQLRSIAFQIAEFF